MKHLSKRDGTYCLLSISLGVLTCYKLHEVLHLWIHPIFDACQGNNDVAQSTLLQPYLTWGVFDPFVCCITQILFHLATHSPGGKMAGISTIIIYMPVLIFMGLEAGRPTAKGFVKYPMIVAMLAQFFGSSVVFPLLWIPSYIWGGGARGLLSKRRILLSVVPPMVYFILSVLTLFFVASPLSPPTKSMVWTTSAGILGGPFIAFSFVPLWLLSQDDEARNNLQSANLSTLPYGAIGVGSFFVWLWSTTLLLLRNVGLSPSGIYQTLWGQAVPAVKFFTLDGLALWLSMLLVIAYQKETSALEAIGLTCLFGPGTGIALVLAGLQVDGDEYEIPCLLEPTIDLGKSKSEILKRKGE